MKITAISLDNGTFLHFLLRNDIPGRCSIPHFIESICQIIVSCYGQGILHKSLPVIYLRLLKITLAKIPISASNLPAVRLGRRIQRWHQKE